MRCFSRGSKYPLIALFIVLMAGCVSVLMAGCVSTKVVYKPGAPRAGVLKLPVKVAVLPFKDGTEDFTTRGHLLDFTLTYNLAKTGSSWGAVDAMPPVFWARAFADDLTASGEFQSVGFFYAPSELTNEDYFVEGTVLKAYYNNVVDSTSEFKLSFQARQRADNRLVWEKEVTRVWQLRLSDGIPTKINQVIQDMFAEARADLVRMLASRSGIRAGEAGAAPAVSSPPSGSIPVDKEIEKILNGQ